MTSNDSTSIAAVAEAVAQAHARASSDGNDARDLDAAPWPALLVTTRVARPGGEAAVEAYPQALHAVLVDRVGPERAHQLEHDLRVAVVAEFTDLHRVSRVTTPAECPATPRATDARPCLTPLDPI
jgi:hypothetical protein